MSSLLIHIPKRSREEVNAYFDGARNGIRLYAVWKDGAEYVGMGRPLSDAFNDLEAMRQAALEGLSSDTETT